MSGGRERALPIKEKKHSIVKTVKKPVLLRKDIRAAGEFEGARPASSWIIAIKNVRKDFLTSVARFFVKHKLHKKCGVFSACKKVTDFFDSLNIIIVSGCCTLRTR